MDRPKPLPSSLRDKRRYVVFRVVSEGPVQIDLLAEEIYSSFSSLFGEVGLALSGLRVMKQLYDPEKKIGIVRCQPGHVEETRFTLSMISNVDETPCVVAVEGVTGTIKTARLKYYR